MTRRSRVALLLVAGAVAVILLGRRWAAGVGASTAIATERMWTPLDRHVEVEVLNAGGEQGSARDASLRLRRAGLDVVHWDNAPPADRDTVPRRPRILVRRDDTTGVGRVIEVLGPSEVVVVTDSTPLVDLTILVWRDLGS